MADACACFENEKEEEKVLQTKEAQKKVVGCYYILMKMIGTSFGTSLNARKK